MADGSYSKKPYNPVKIGERLGRLTVIERAGSTASGNKNFLCLCVCGTRSVVAGSALRGGTIISCGCYRRDKHLTHGLSNRPEFHVWASMTQRCLNPNVKNFDNYGGRGIAVCERWKNFELFFEDMGPRPTPRHTLERIDNESGYCAENCRWATYKEQANNTRRNRIVIFDGRKMTLTQAIELSSVNRHTIEWRIANKWPEDRWFIPPRTS